MDNAVVSVEHYENFPVASVLCPAPLRPAVAAIYHFARTADDIADEGNAPATERLADLQDYRADLAATAAGGASSRRWPTVFGPLRSAMKKYDLPIALLTDLLSAFEQDVVTTRYASRGELLDYCRRSANPVGRLVLHLHGITDAKALRQSDDICTALQLANFWQDLSVDTARGRLYIPVEDCSRLGVAPQDLLARRDSAQAQALIADLVGWAGDLMRSGSPLVHAVPGRAGWELRLVVQGGSRILEKIGAMNFTTLQDRPTLGWQDLPAMLWRALWMRPPGAVAVAGRLR